MSFKNPFAKSHSKSELELFKFLKKINLFSKLSYEEISYFAPYMHERSYRQGEVLFFRGDPAHALYIIRRGEISLNLDIKDSLECLTVLLNGNTAGDNCLLQNSRRIYTAVVESETADIYVLPQVNILEIFDVRPAIKAKMIESMAERYNEFIQKLFATYKSSYGFFDLSQVYEGVR
jgi:CRP/FNR family transcriptional regulator, cyclic AMP receptor protein